MSFLDTLLRTYGPLLSQVGDDPAMFYRWNSASPKPSMDMSVLNGIRARLAPNSDGVYYNTATSWPGEEPVPVPADAPPPLPPGEQPPAQPPAQPYEMPEVSGTSGSAAYEMPEVSNLTPQSQAPHRGGIRFTPQFQQQAGRVGRGILGGIQEFFSPTPGSYWWAAQNGGLANARETMRRYPMQIAAEQTAAQQAAANAARAQTQADVAAADAAAGRRTVGGHIYAPDPNNPDMMRDTTPPAAQPSGPIQLIQAWEAADPNTERGRSIRRLIEQALPGYRFTPEVMERQNAGQRSVAAARATANANAQRNNYDYRRTHPMPSRSAGGTSRRTTQLPRGWVIEQ